MRHEHHNDESQVAEEFELHASSIHATGSTSDVAIHNFFVSRDNLYYVIKVEITTYANMKA